MSFTGAAASVVALIFQLVSDAGDVVAELGAATQPFSGYGLVMKHNESALTDSGLRWKYNSTGTPTNLINVELATGYPVGAYQPSSRVYLTDSTSGSTMEISSQAHSLGPAGGLTGQTGSTGALLQLYATAPSPSLLAASVDISTAAGTATSISSYVASAGTDVARTTVSGAGTITDTATTINLNPSGRVALNGRNTLLPVDYQQYVLPATLVNPAAFSFLMNGINTTVKDGDYLEICWHCRWDSGAAGSQFQAQPQVYNLTGGTVTIAQRIFATYTGLSSNTLSGSTMYGPITTAGAAGTAITVTISGGTVAGTGNLVLTETWFTVQVLSAR